MFPPRGNGSGGIIKPGANVYGLGDYRPGNLRLGDFPGYLGGVGIPAPIQAAGVGYSSLTYNSSFTPSQVDTGNTKASGFKWYPWSFFGGSTNLSAIALNGDNSVTLAGDTSGPNGEIAMAVDKGSGTFAGTAFGGGAYFEATMKFNPQDVINNSFSGCPAFWMSALEHLVSMAGQQWPGQAAGFNHFAEVDVLEYDKSSLVPSSGTNFFGAGWHDWYGAGLGGSEPNSPSYSQTIVTVPNNPDLTKYHKYGCLWVPATVTTRGYIKFYFDDVLVGRSMSWSQYNSNQSPPVAAVFTATHSQDDWGWQGNNLRQVLAPGLLTASSGGKIIVGMLPGFCATGSTIDSMWVGHSAVSGNEYNFDGNQVQLTFNGLASYPLGDGQDITSDAIPFVYDHTRKLVISMHFSGTDVEFGQQNSLTGATAYTSVAVHSSSGNPQADSSGQTTVTMGASEATTCVAVNNIWVQDTSPLSILDQQHLVPILGTGPNMPLTVKSMRVWQASNANNLSA